MDRALQEFLELNVQSGGRGAPGIADWMPDESCLG
jgi:hypothetical protein